MEETSRELTPVEGFLYDFCQAIVMLSLIAIGFWATYMVLPPHQADEPVFTDDHHYRFPVARGRI